MSTLADLIEGLEVAIVDEAYDGYAGPMSPQQYSRMVRRIAEAAAEVVAKLAPSDVEFPFTHDGVTLTLEDGGIRADGGSRNDHPYWIDPYALAALRAAGVIQRSVPEPQDGAEPPGEPSDAEAALAIRGLDHLARNAGSPAVRTDCAFGRNVIRRLIAERDAAMEVMNQHRCGEHAEAAYRRAVRAESLAQGDELKVGDRVVMVAPSIFIRKGAEGVVRQFGVPNVLVHFDGDEHEHWVAPSALRAAGGVSGG